MEKLELTLFEKIKFTISDFINNWIYPAYYLKNILFYRYDIVRLSEIPIYKYSDVNERMFLANMSLIVDFLEKENPEKYVLWYKDENGKDIGHKYGEYKDSPILYPEYKDKFIMDIIKEIYNWYKKEFVLLTKEHEYLLSFWSDNIIGEMVFDESEDTVELDINDNKLLDLNFDNSACPKTLEELEKNKNINWEIIDKYIPDRNKIFEEDYVHNIISDLDTQIFNAKQKYLHLCIEVRPYLWI